MSQLKGEEAKTEDKTRAIIIRTASFIGLVFVFLIFHEMMTHSIGEFGSATVEEIIIATSNPFISLFIGLLSTAIIQSSSTTTSMVVAVVASGTIDLPSAIPMIMGANIGTTLTSTLVSLAHLNKQKEFRRAIYVGTVHDFFNIFNTLLLLPLEYYFGILSSMSGSMASFFYTQSDEATGFFNILDYTIKPVTTLFLYVFGSHYWLAFIASFIGLFSTIKAFLALLRSSLIGERQSRLEKHVFGNKLKSMFWGAATTAGIHSSSVITSLIVPVVTARKIGLKTIYPFILGSNIGTTITALIAAISKSEAALSVAMAHFLFNIIGVIIFAPFLPTSNFPISLAKWLGKKTSHNRLAIFFYITIVFFILPFLLIYATSNSFKLKEYEFEIYDKKQDTTYHTVLIDEIRKMRQSKFYTTYNIFRDPNFKKGQKLSKKIKVLQYKDVLFIGNDKYPLAGTGTCFDMADSLGKYKICLDTIQADYALNNKIKSDTCYIYQKRYYQKGLPRQHLFLDTKRKLIIKQESYNADSTLIRKKQLMHESVK